MNFNQIKFGKPVTYLDGVVNYLKGAMIWGFRSKYKWSQTTPDIWGFANPTDIDPEATAIYNRIIADGGVSNLTRLNYFVVGLKTIYATLDNVPVCYDAHWIGYKLGSGTGATAGQAAAKLYSLTVAGDAIQSTAASQPLLLAHNGDNYWWGSGVDGNYVSTANRTPAGSTQLDVRVKFEGGNLNSGRTFFSQSGSGGGETDIFILRFQNASTGTINMLFGAGLTLSQTSSVGIGAIANYAGWIRVTYLSNGVTADVTFFSSTDGITYTQLSTHTVVSARLGNQNSPYQIGSNIGFNPFQGKISRATASNSIGGAPVVDFNPATYNASTSQTAWTSSTGEVWTINTGTATTGYKGVLVDRTIVQGDGVDDLIKNTPFATSANCTDYIAFEQFGWVSADFIFDGSVVDSIALQQTSISPNIRFEGAGGGGGVSNFVVNTLSMATILGTSSAGSVNLFRNNTSVGIGGTKADSQGYTLFARANSTSFGNASINTMIKVLGQDDVTKRTATYNLIRSLNNNAF